MPINDIKGVVCCGNVVFDIAVWPVEDCVWNTTTWVDTISEGIGGNGANTSWALAKLGVPVKLISVVGADDRGDRLLSTLQSVGVDCSGVGRADEWPTPATVVLSHKGGDRKFLHRPGASRHLSADRVQFDGDPAISHFHLANSFALPSLRAQASEIMQRARQAGLTTSMDTGWDSQGRWLEDLEFALADTDLLFVNDSEARLLGGSDELPVAVAAIQQCGVRDVVVKTGVKGCSVYSADSVLHVMGFPVEAIDTTGAGDCFAGAFLAGLGRGWSYPECARLANAVGAMNVEHIGATEGVRSMSETMLWMEARQTS